MKMILIQLVTAWFMTGVIWTVQVVHYPLFAQVGLEEFQTYEALHTKWITYVVAAPMLVELFLAGFWLIQDDRRIPKWMPYAGALLVGIIWFATFAFSVHYHNQLMRGFRQDSWSGLVTTNWIRTACWTARGILLVYALDRVWRWEASSKALTSPGSSQNIQEAAGE